MSPRKQIRVTNSMLETLLQDLEQGKYKLVCHDCEVDTTYQDAMLAVDTKESFIPGTRRVKTESYIKFFCKKCTPMAKARYEAQGAKNLDDNDNNSDS
jgi:hypothetical protein